MAKKLIDVQANGFKSYVDATAAAVGAEPALSDPGPGTWYLRAIDNVRSWVAQIPWAGIDKTGAVAADVGALPDASPTIASGKLTTAVSTTSGASLNVPNGAVPTSPAVGDIWADASRLFMQGRVLAVTKGASNSFSSGSAFSVLDAASPTKGAHIQLNAAGGMDVWTLQGGSWIKELTLPIDGSIQLENLAGTGTRAVAADSTGKLVTAAAADLPGGPYLPVTNPTATGTLTAPDVVVSNLAGGVRFVVTDAAGKLVATYAPPSLPYLPTSGGIVSGDVAIDGLLRSQHSYPIPSGAFTLTDSFPNNSAFTVSGAATCDLDGTLSPGIEFTIATLASAITLQFSTVTCYLNGTLVPTGTVLPQGRMYKMQLFNGTVWFING